jgi:hypothetical protein
MGTSVNGIPMMIDTPMAVLGHAAIPGRLLSMLRNVMTVSVMAAHRLRFQVHQLKTNVAALTTIPKMITGTGISSDPGRRKTR